MAAGTYNFTIEQGARFSKRIEWKDAADDLVPLTGLAARMHLRPKVDSATVLLEMTTDNGRITLTDPGIIEWALGADVTADLDFSSAVYDLEIYDPLDDTVVDRLLEGKVTLKKEVTRP